MPIRKKINLKRYFIYLILHLVLTYFFVQSIAEFGIILLVFVATVLNQWMLIDSVEALVRGVVNKDNPATTKIVLMFLGKTILLMIALSFGVHIMGKRVIIPLLNYVVQIFILYFSFKRRDCE